MLHGGIEKIPPPSLHRTLPLRAKPGHLHRRIDLPSNIRSINDTMMGPSKSRVSESRAACASTQTSLEALRHVSSMGSTGPPGNPPRLSEKSWFAVITFLVTLTPAIMLSRCVPHSAHHWHGVSSESVPLGARRYHAPMAVCGAAGLRRRSPTFELICECTRTRRGKARCSCCTESLPFPWPSAHPSRAELPLPAVLQCSMTPSNKVEVQVIPSHVP